MEDDPTHLETISSEFELIDIPERLTPSVVFSQAKFFHSNYVHDPLPNNRCIRLVNLSKEGLKAGISIQQVRLDEAPRFSALSYAWGPLSDKLKVQANGFRLSQNLVDAICCFAVVEPGFWWIDGLCINQDDAKEKNQQVRIMNQIYRKAKQVRVWLGLGDEFTSSCLALLDRFGDLRREGKTSWPPVRAPDLFCDDEMERLGLPKVDDPVWIAFLRLLNRSYFTRVWVVQELVMAAKPIMVYCGELSFRWDSLEETVAWLQKAQWLNEISRKIAQPSNSLLMDGSSIIRLKALLNMPTQSSFEDVLLLCRGLKATDPRDHIIATLGLLPAEDEVVAAIEPRYDQSVAEFYRDVTGTIITRGQSLGILSAVEDSLSRDVRGLPSWVPDYSKESYRGWFRHACQVSQVSTFRVNWSPGSNVLRLYTRMVDEVDSVADSVAAIGELNVSSLLYSWLKMAAQRASMSPWHWMLDLFNSHTRASRDVVSFWRTLVMNTVAGQTPASDEYGIHFAALMFNALMQYEGPPVDEAGQRIVPEALSVGGPRGEGKLFVDRLGQTLMLSRFFISKSGLMGLGPMSAQPGDKIIIISGAQQIFLTRQQGQDFQLVGNSYVHDLTLNLDISEFEEITLV